MMALFGLAAAGSTACATKGYVNTEVASVNQKVDTLTQSLEENQERTQQNEGRITEVDERAQTAAGEARNLATEAGQQASAAGDAASSAAARAEEVDLYTKRMVFEVVLNENQGNFEFGGSDLPDEAKVRIDEMVTQLKADPKGAYFEIAGHTDSTGPATLNERIGLERAESVKRYLYEQHQIPLHRINVISYGEENPLAPNDTREGRAQNRAVVIRVLI
jgi:outer membrane protein OmpA-like peptidoglycan-associated protein